MHQSPEQTVQQHTLFPPNNIINNKAKQNFLLRIITIFISYILKYKNVSEIPLILYEQDQGAIFSASLYTFPPDCPPQCHTFSPCQN